MFLTKKISIIIFETSEKEERLRSLIESLGNGERAVRLNNSPNSYIVEYHDGDIHESLRKVKINGNRIVAANYALLVEGALCRDKIDYRQTRISIPAEKWKRM